MKLLLSTLLTALSLSFEPAAASAATLRPWPKLTATKTGQVSVTCALYLLGARPGSHYVATLPSGGRFDVYADALGCGYITTLRTVVANKTHFSGTVTFFTPDGINRGELTFGFPVEIDSKTLVSQPGIVLTTISTPTPDAEAPTSRHELAPLPTVSSSFQLNGTWSSDSATPVTVTQKGDSVEVHLPGHGKAFGYIEGSIIHLWDRDNDGHIVKHDYHQGTIVNSKLVTWNSHNGRQQWTRE